MRSWCDLLFACKKQTLCQRKELVPAVKRCVFDEY
jgi:hypothetical protein